MEVNSHEYRKMHQDRSEKREISREEVEAYGKEVSERAKWALVSIIVSLTSLIINITMLYIVQRQK